MLGFCLPRVKLLDPGAHAIRNLLSAEGAKWIPAFRAFSALTKERSVFPFISGGVNLSACKPKLCVKTR
jgi:hypothetical protein